MPQLILGTCSLGVFFIYFIFLWLMTGKKRHVCTECSNLSLVRDEPILSFLPFLRERVRTGWINNDAKLTLFPNAANESGLSQRKLLLSSGDRPNTKGREEVFCNH